MATVAEVQTQLGDDVHSPRIIKSEIRGTNTAYLTDGGATVPGRCRWTETASAGSAATQAAAILVSLKA